MQVRCVRAANEESLTSHNEIVVAIGGSLHELRHLELTRNKMSNTGSYPSRKSATPMRNIIWGYPDSNEEYEEYYSLPPLRSCFQTPQPCATINTVHHNSHSNVDLENITLEEYASYELAMSTIKSTIQEDSNLDEILDDLFRIGADNIRNMKHEVPNRCDDEIVDITDYEDSDQEDGELPDLSTFLATNVFASIYEHVNEDIDISITKIKEEVHVEDVQMDENYNIDHSDTEETLH
nr:hypothetical protein [Tanacetum cinerariifolium]